MKQQKQAETNNGSKIVASQSRKLLNGPNRRLLGAGEKYIKQYPFFCRHNRNKNRLFSHSTGDFFQ